MKTAGDKGSAAVLLAIGVGLVGLYVMLRPKKADAAPCTTTDTQIAAFAKSKGYHIWWVVDKPAVTWSAAKPQYTSDKMARAFSVPDCAFFKWSQGAWVVDTATAIEFAQWKQATK